MAAKKTKQQSTSNNSMLMLVLGLILLIFPIIFYSRFVTRAFDLTKSALFTWLWLIIGSWVLFINLRRDQDWIKTPLLIPIIGYAVSLVFSTIFSITPIVSFLGVYERQMGLITQLQAVSLAFIFAGIINKKNLLNVAVDTLIVFGTVNGLIGVSQFLGFDPLGFTSGYATQAFGFLGNPDFFGPVMVITTFLTLGRLLSDEGGENSWIWLSLFFIQFLSLLLTAQGAFMGAFGGLTASLLLFYSFFSSKERSKTQSWAFAAVVVALIALALSLVMYPAERTINIFSAALGTGVGVTLWAIANLLFLSRKEMPMLWRISAVLVILVIVVGIVGVYEIYSLQPVTIADKLGSTVGTRLVLWKHTLGFSLQNTIHGRLFGIGIESFRRGFMQYKPLELSQLEPNVNYDDPHNNFLGVLAKVGIVGFIFYLWIFISAAGMLYKMLKSVDSEKDKLLILGMAAALAAYATNLITIFDMLPSLMLFYAFLGLIIASYNIFVKPSIVTASYERETKPWLNLSSLVAWAVLLVFALYNGYYYINAWAAEENFRKGLGNLQYYETNKGSTSATQNLQIIESSLYYLNQAMKYNPHESYYAINYMRAASDFWDLTYTSSSTQANNVVATALAKAQQYESSTWAPENLYATMGNVYAKLGGIDEAIKAFQEAVNWDHQFYSARMNLAILLTNRAQNYLTQNNKDAAIKDLNDALVQIKYAQQVLALTQDQNLISLRNQMAGIQSSIESMISNIK